MGGVKLYTECSTFSSIVTSLERDSRYFFSPWSPAQFTTCPTSGLTEDKLAVALRLGIFQLRVMLV